MDAEEIKWNKRHPLFAAANQGLLDREEPASPTIATTAREALEILANADDYLSAGERQALRAKLSAIVTEATATEGAALLSVLHPGAEEAAGPAWACAGCGLTFKGEPAEMLVGGTMPYCETCRDEMAAEEEEPTWRR